MITTCFSARAAVIETFTGQTVRGTAVLADTLEITTPEGLVKFSYDQILRASLDDSVAPEEVPAGLVLVDGTRVAQPLGALGGAVIEAPKRQLRVPAGSIAWIVYTPFAPALAGQLPAGKVGALLPGGDFFEGTLKGADDARCKLLNPIFGLRTFEAARGDLHALVLKDTKSAPANYEVRASDGSLFLADSIVPERGGLTLRGGAFHGLHLEGREVAELRAGATRYLALATLPMRPPATKGFSINQTLAGEPLTGSNGERLRGFESAVGAAAGWDVPAGFTALTAEVRIPRDLPPGHKFAFVVYADGRPVFRTSALTCQDSPVTFRAPLGTARVLALRLEAVFPTQAPGRGLWLAPTLLRR